MSHSLYLNICESVFLSSHTKQRSLKAFPIIRLHVSHQLLSHKATVHKMPTPRLCAARPRRKSHLISIDLDPYAIAEELY